MQPDGPEPGFHRAQFSSGFLDHGGPYYLAEKAEGQEGQEGQEGKPRSLGLRIMAHHINYQSVAHGGAISTMADVALSHAVYDSMRPHPVVATISLTTNFLAPAQLGDWLVGEVAIDRIAGRTAFCSGRLVRGDTPIATISAVIAVRRP